MYPTMSARKLGTGSHDVSDPETEEISINVKANFAVKLLARYEQVEDLIIWNISTNEDYKLEPVLIAEDVDTSVLEKIPSRTRG